MAVGMHFFFPWRGRAASGCALISYPTFGVYQVLSSFFLSFLRVEGRAREVPDKPGLLLDSQVMTILCVIIAG